MKGEQKQKEISVSITKIFNWPQSQSNAVFDLTFYPQDSDNPIIEKTVQGVFLSNSMNLNASLKITYTDDQKIIILKLMKNTKKDRREILGEFQIDLDALRQKNVQYFPFGKDHVLQINLYNPTKMNSRTSRADQNILTPTQTRNSRLNTDTRLFDHQRYLIERQNYLQRQTRQSRRVFNSNNNNRYYQYQNNYEPHFPYESRVKKSFSQKVYNLLQQVKSMKEDIAISTKSKDQKKNRNNQRNQIDNRDQEIDNFDSQDKYQPRIKKSMSDGKFKSYGSVSGGGQGTFRREQQPNKGPKAQKHRLILSTLNVVPCDEYYKNQTNAKPISKNKQQNGTPNYTYQSNPSKINSGQSPGPGASPTVGNGNYNNYYHSRFN